MTRRVVIHQPDFIPYLGFFHRFVQADLYIALDHVQFVNGTSKAWTHRDKIKTPTGAKWLSISVKKAPRDTPINQIKLSETVGWRDDHMRQIHQLYRNALYFRETMPTIEAIYANDSNDLATFNLNSIQILMEVLGVNLPTILSSTLEPVGQSNEMLVDLLQKVGATEYVSGVGARDYFDPIPFDSVGIKVTWQNFEHPVYEQQHGKFIPFLSSIDMLFNCGHMSAGSVLRGHSG